MRVIKTQEKMLLTVHVNIVTALVISIVIYVIINKRSFEPFMCLVLIVTARLKMIGEKKKKKKKKKRDREEE